MAVAALAPSSAGAVMPAFTTGRKDTGGRRGIRTGAYFRETGSLRARACVSGRLGGHAAEALR